MAPSTEKYSFAADVSLSSERNCSVMYNLYLEDSLMQTAKRAALNELLWWCVSTVYTEVSEELVSMFHVAWRRQDADKAILTRFSTGKM